MRAKRVFNNRFVFLLSTKEASALEGLKRFTKKNYGMSKSYVKGNKFLLNERP